MKTPLPALALLCSILSFTGPSAHAQPLPKITVESWEDAIKRFDARTYNMFEEGCRGVEMKLQGVSIWEVQAAGRGKCQWVPAFAIGRDGSRKETIRFKLEVDSDDACEVTLTNGAKKVKFKIVCEGT